MKTLLLSTVLLLALSTCCPTQTDCVEETPAVVRIIQLNDVYEIDGIEHGAYGDLSRVATLLRQYAQDSIPTVSLLSGDFISPSLFNTLDYPQGAEGDRLVNGRQMIEVLNAMGLDYATFGNHEFDLKGIKAVQNRILESDFTWLSSNVSKRTEEGHTPFTLSQSDSLSHPVPLYVIDTLQTTQGPVNIGWLGLTLAFGSSDEVQNTDYLQAAKTSLQALSGTDIQLAITHLAMDQDLKLASQSPSPNAIFGGHEHINYASHSAHTPIFKADANARTIYEHLLYWYPACQELQIVSHLIEINPLIDQEPNTKRVIDAWLSFRDSALIKQGFVPDEVIYSTTEQLDATERSIRTHQTNMGTLIANAAQSYEGNPGAALINAGSIRLDGYISGEVQQLDILKTLPYGGTLVSTEMTGELLLKTLNTSEQETKTLGSYLQYSSSISYKEGGWQLAGKPIIPESTYEIILTEYLVTAGDQKLEFLVGLPYTVLRPAEEGSTPNDLRMITIDYMRRL